MSNPGDPQDRGLEVVETLLRQAGRPTSAPYPQETGSLHGTTMARAGFAVPMRSPSHRRTGDRLRRSMTLEAAALFPPRRRPAFPARWPRVPGRYAIRVTVGARPAARWHGPGWWPGRGSRDRGLPSTSSGALGSRKINRVWAFDCLPEQAHTRSPGAWAGVTTRRAGGYARSRPRRSRSGVPRPPMPPP